RSSTRSRTRSSATAAAAAWCAQARATRAATAARRPAAARSTSPSVVPSGRRKAARAVQTLEMPIVEISTPYGPARARVDRVPEPRGALVLGHGAGGGVNAPDLAAAGRAGRASGFTVVLVEQPYRVAGRRSPAPATQLDAAWKAVLASLTRRRLAGLPIVVGGRSSG